MPKQIHSSRIVLAFCVTPALLAFYAALFMAQPWLLPIGLAAGYACELIVGLPAFLILHRSQRLGWWAFVLAGVVCSLPAIAGYWSIGSIPHLQKFDAAAGFAMCAWGAIGGAFFWLLGLAGDSPLKWRNFFDLGPPD
jgi:hypothetical protein